MYVTDSSLFLRIKYHLYERRDESADFCHIWRFPKFLWAFEASPVPEAEESYIFERYDFSCEESEEAFPDTFQEYSKYADCYEKHDNNGICTLV